MKLHYRSKYGAIKLRLNGHAFASHKEARRYRELCLLEAAGEINELEVFPRYMLLEGFLHRGITYLPVSYTADFRYQEDGLTIVEDVKSEPTRKKPDYIIRKKLLLSQHPEIVFRET